MPAAPGWRSPPPPRAPSNGFRLSVSDDDGAAIDDGLGLSRFAFDPAAGSNGMDLKAQGLNALASVNGIEVSSASNTLDGVIEGLNLTLRGVGGPTDVTVSQDRDAVKTAITEFAKAYSDLTRTISEQTKYDAGSQVSGPLQGDSAATGLQRQLRSLLGAGTEASTVFPRMADVGLELQRDGTLIVDEGKLNAALGNLPELRNAFAANDADAARDGFARRYADLAMQVTGVDGSLTTRSEGLRARITQNGEAQTALEERVERFRSRLVAQYTAMDANLAKLNALSSYVSQQLTSLSLSNQDRN
jgi:flagellar hook-associated protein 2